MRRQASDEGRVASQHKTTSSDLKTGGKKTVSAWTSRAAHSHSSQFERWSLVSRPAAAPLPRAATRFEARRCPRMRGVERSRMRPGWNPASADKKSAVCPPRNPETFEKHTVKLPKAHPVCPESLVVPSVSKHKRGRRWRSWRGAPHLRGCRRRARCNLSISSLFTSLFSFFLNYLKCYLSNKEILKKKKKRTCRFFALWLMSVFLRRNVCVFSLSVP